MMMMIIKIVMIMIMTIMTIIIIIIIVIINIIITIKDATLRQQCRKPTLMFINSGNRANNHHREPTEDKLFG